MSAPDCPDVCAVEQLVQDLRDLAKLLGVNLDAPDTGPLLLAILRLVSQRQSQPAKSRRKPTWKAGQYEELFRDVNQTKARLNCFRSKTQLQSLNKERQKRAVVEAHEAVA